MRKNNILTYVVGIVIVVMVGTAVYQNLVSADNDISSSVEVSAKPGFQAPSFELEGLDGLTYKAGGEKDKPLLINFWASWCGPCHIEAPDLQKLYTKYENKLDIYAVNVTSLDTRKGALEFVQEHGLTFPIPMDHTGEVTSKRFGVDGYPASFLIDQKGIVVDAIFGIINPKDLSRKIDSLLK